VPDSAAFGANIPRIIDADRPNVDLNIHPAFVVGKLHILQFSDRLRTLVDNYKNFEIYEKEATHWAKLVDGQPPLWVGSPRDDTLHGYLDFFASGEPALTNDGFWNAFALAEAQIGAVLGADIAILRIDFDDDWAGGGLHVGGVALEAADGGNRHAYVGVLYSAADSGLDGTTLLERLGERFRVQFAVPSGSTQESETREWGYPNHIWSVQWETPP
jgi:hypothetical protein